MALKCRQSTGCSVSFPSRTTQPSPSRRLHPTIPTPTRSFNLFSCLPHHHSIAVLFFVPSNRSPFLLPLAPCIISSVQSSICLGFRSKAREGLGKDLENGFFVSSVSGFFFFCLSLSLSLPPSYLCLCFSFCLTFSSFSSCVCARVCLSLG